MREVGGEILRKDDAEDVSLLMLTKMEDGGERTWKSLY